jgi:hypothetical protein
MRICNLPEPVMKRVLGPDNPRVLQTVMNYAISILNSGRLVEAEAMLAQNVAAHTRVMGSDHPSTLYAAEMLAAVRNELQRK